MAAVVPVAALPDREREGNDRGEHWLDVAIGDILRRECTQVLWDATFPSDPFAR